MSKFELTKTEQWKALEQQRAKNKDINLRELFKEPGRAGAFSVKDDNLGLLFDYSKNLINREIFDLLIGLAKAAGVNENAQKMFAGEKINWTEKRAVLHTALRNRSNKPVYVDGKNIMPEINAVLEKMRIFSDDVRKGKWLGATGKRITDIVNIGIGGSDLGPKMVCEALKFMGDGLNATTRSEELV